jgi:pimeloyl-ACP methyl ester carboxylesterase
MFVVPFRHHSWIHALCLLVAGVGGDWLTLPAEAGEPLRHDGQQQALLLHTPAGDRGPYLEQTRVLPGAPFRTVLLPTAAESGFSTWREQALAAAVAQEQAGSPGCVDAYFQCALFALQGMQPALAALQRDEHFNRAWSLYHLGLAKVIELGQRFGRLDPRRELRIQTTAGPATVPITHHTSAWLPADHQQLVVVGEYHAQQPKRIYRRPGLGIPLIALRHAAGTGDFLTPGQPFAATAVLRLVPGGAAGTWPADGGVAATGMVPVIELYAPLQTPTVELGGNPVPLAADVTAPLAFAWSIAEREPIRDALQPGTSRAQAALHFLEPYQPGKIPLVFVHGLLSDAFTWLDLANELQMHPQITSRYQVWAYRYPTGQAFLVPAADFREQLQRAVNTLNPGGADPALGQMVIVGHSMGGLMAKLQVTHSGAILWNLAANRPMDQIQADPQTRSQLARALFFEPLPFVRRVVFIGTPHGGSPLATLTVARIGSGWIEPPTDLDRRYRALIAQNPGVFAANLRRRLPTSIDMLEPDSSLLLGIRQLPVASHVQLHSIIGYGHHVPFSGDGDGVVPVSSARHPGVVSEQFVRARHVELHHQPETINGLLQILVIHAAQCDVEAAAARRNQGG